MPFIIPDRLYPERRTLRRYARVLQLGALAALTIMAVMFAAIPHAGGAYSFARTVMGTSGGYITGLAENRETILTPAVIVLVIVGYLGAILAPEEKFAEEVRAAT